MDRKILLPETRGRTYYEKDGKIYEKPLSVKVGWVDWSKPSKEEEKAYERYRHPPFYERLKLIPDFLLWVFTGSDEYYPF